MLKKLWILPFIKLSPVFPLECWPYVLGWSSLLYAISVIQGFNVLLSWTISDSCYTNSIVTQATKKLVKLLTPPAEGRGSYVAWKTGFWWCPHVFALSMIWHGEWELSQLNATLDRIKPRHTSVVNAICPLTARADCPVSPPLTSIGWFLCACSREFRWYKHTSRLLVFLFH